MPCALTSSDNYSDYLETLLKIAKVGNDEKLKTCACSLKTFTNNDGCPVLDENGKIIAFPFCKSNFSNNYINAIPNESAKLFWLDNTWQISVNIRYRIPQAYTIREIKFVGVTSGKYFYQDNQKTILTHFDPKILCANTVYADVLGYRTAYTPWNPPEIVKLDETSTGPLTGVLAIGGNVFEDKIYFSFSIGELLISNSPSPSFLFKSAGETCKVSFFDKQIDIPVYFASSLSVITSGSDQYSNAIGWPSYGAFGPIEIKLINQSNPLS